MAYDKFREYVTALYRMDDVGFIDSSVPRGREIAVLEGAPTIRTAQYKFAPSSLYLDGSSALQSPLDESFMLHAGGDWTIEGWIYPTTTTGYRSIIAKRYSTQSDWELLLNTSSNKLEFYNGTEYIGTIVMAANAWHHVAVTRQGTTLKFWVNGALDAIFTGVTLTDRTNNRIFVGRSEPTNAEHWIGYMQCLRVTRGLARYTSAFSTPAAAFPSNSTDDPDFDKVILLLNFAGEDFVATFEDSSRWPVSNYTWTVTGSPTISTAQSKFGGKSWCTTPSSGRISGLRAGANLGGGPWTVDLWVYPTTGTGSWRNPISKRSSGGTTKDWDLSLDLSTNRMCFYNGTQYYTSATVAINAWTHWAASWDGHNLRLFLDGALSGTYAFASNPVTDHDATPLNIGDGSNGLNEWFYGYLDQIRITKGACRWTSSFVPDTTPADLNALIVSGAVSKGTPPDPVARKIVLMRTSDYKIVGTGESSPDDGAYSIETIAELDIDEGVIGMVYPDYGEPSIRSQVYVVGDRTWVGAPAPLGHWYECESAGTTGSTEPTWPTDGSTVNDGTVVWRDKGVMERPWAEGPYLAEAA